MSLVMSFVVFLGAKELIRMVANRQGQNTLALGGWTWLGALPAAFLPFFVYLAGYQIVLPYLIFIVFVCLALRMRFGGELSVSLNWLLGVLLALVYLAIPLTAFVGIKGFAGGGFWLLFVMVIVWANDIFAYYTGKLLGTNKLSPVISPNKTYEGAIGGLVGGVVVAFLYNYYFSMGMGFFGIIFVAVILGIIGITGDLAESLIKRATGVKDSGTLIPGHGGVMDRIDSLIFTVPALYYYLLWQGV
jgi:phosphatidate cytidylyltransferase